MTQEEKLTSLIQQLIDDKTIIVLHPIYKTVEILDDYDTFKQWLEDIGLVGPGQRFTDAEMIDQVKAIELGRETREGKII